VPGGKGGKDGKKPGKGKLSARACRPTARHDGWEKTQYYDSLDKTNMISADEVCAAGNKLMRKRTSMKPAFDAQLDKRTNHKYAMNWEDWEKSKSTSESFTHIS
jgi:hypothetical protein